MNKNKRYRKINWLTSRATLDAIKLFEETFPDADDNDFEMFYSCLTVHLINELHRWRIDKFAAAC